MCGRPSPLIQPQVLRGGTYMEWAEAQTRNLGEEEIYVLVKVKVDLGCKEMSESCSPSSEMM